MSKNKKAVKINKKSVKKNKPKKTKLPVKLVNYLEKAGVRHRILEHRTVYTAVDAAATMKKKLNEVVKSLLVKADKDYYLVLLTADCNLDFYKLGKCIGARTGRPIKAVKIPTEAIMTKIFKIRAGAMGAFGKLHKLPVIMDKKITKIRQAVFSSGSFNHSVEMAVKDFIKLEDAVLGSFSKKKKIKIQKAGGVKNSGGKKRAPVKKQKKQRVIKL